MKIFTFPTKTLTLLLGFLITNFIHANNYYWVGNSGNWNDASHWASSSGGAGGAGVPGINDNVYFDGNSFSMGSVVTINSTASCKSFIWEDGVGEHELAGNGTLNVKGSFVVESALDNNYTGGIHFIANLGNHDIDADDVQWKSDFWFEGNGTYNLANHFATTRTNTITVQKGTLNTNNFILYTGAFKTASSGNKDINLGSSTVHIHDEWDVETGANIDLDASQSELILLESIQPEKIKKGGFDYNNVSTKAACATPIPIDFTVTTTSNYNGSQISCNGQCDAELTITVNAGGGGPYGYEYDDGNGPQLSTSNVITGLCADTYNVTVYDSSQVVFGNIYESCTEFGVVITAPAAIGVNVQGFLDPTCPTSCDGAIFTSIGGGTGVLTIEWPGIAPNPFVGEDPVGVCTGTHTVNVTDENGCFHTEDVVLNDPPAIVSNIVVGDVSCTGLCDAQAYVTPSGGNGGPWTYDWTDSPATTTLSITDTLNGMCENTTYIVNIFDVDGCQHTESFTVGDMPDIFPNVDSQTDATCFGVCNGETTVSATGGSGTFVSYEWYQGTFGAGVLHGNGQTMTDLCAFTDYYVVVTDDNGCQDSIAIPQLSSPPDIVLDTTVTDILCFGDGNGAIDLSVVGGTPFMPGSTYNYTWSTADGSGLVVGTQDQSTLGGGTYKVIVEDANGCLDSLEAVLVVEPPEIFANGITTDNSCFNIVDGTIDLSTTGGVGGYTWTWISGPTGFVDPGTEDINPADSGCYTVRIEDLNNCQLDTTLCLITPGEIFANGVVTPITCGGADDADITLSPSNGVGAYTFDWISGGVGTGPFPCAGPYTDPQDQTALSPGDYQVCIQDGNGCVKDTLFTITDPPAINISETHVDLTCFQDGTGSINITVTGGTGALTFTWSTADGCGLVTNDEDQTGLCAGTYTVLVEDANNCTETMDITITEPDEIFAVGTHTDVSCFNTLDGSIDLSPTGGTGVITVSWTSTNPAFVDPGTEDLTGLDSATYCARVEDAVGCFIDTCFNLIKPGEIYANAAITPIQCNGDNNAMIDLTPLNGVPGYGFDWTNNGAGPFTDPEDQGPLGPGTYTVYIQDANGCVKDTSITFTEPQAIVLDMDSIESTCGNADGQVSVAVTGGTVAVDYTYFWTDNASGLQVGGNSNTVTGLPAGCYDVLVTDDNGCTETGQVCFSDQNAPSATLTVTHNSCYESCDGAITVVITGGVAPLTTTWTTTHPTWTDPGTDNIFNLCAADYTFQIVDANNCVFTQTETITQPDSIITPVVVTDNPCFGDAVGAIDLDADGGTVAVADAYNFSWTGPGAFSANTEDISNLVSGTYNLTITDDNGCTKDTSIVVSEQSEVQLTTSAIDAQCGVSNGSVTVVATGGIVATDYQYSWVDNGTGGVVGTTATVVNLPGGAYTVTVTDDNGCTATATQTINEGNSPTLTVDNFTDITCFGADDGTASVTGSGGVGILTYSWVTVPAGGPAPGNEQNPTGMGPATYAVTVTDAVGCSSTEVLTINEPAAISVPGIVTDATCNGATGTIDITPAGGTQPFTFDWNNDGTNDYDDNEDLIATAGNYCVVVQDDNGCLTASTCFDIQEPTLITTTTSSVNSTCTQSDGSVTVVAADGTPGTPPNEYTYEWYPAGTILPDPGAQLGNAATLSNQPAGCYDVYVTDFNSCVVMATECVSDVNGPTLSAVVTDVTCNGGADGAIDLTTSGGGGGYSWVWTGPGVTQPNDEDQTGLTAGEYSVTVTDATGCTSGLTDTVQEPAPITATAVLTNPLCDASADGAIDITINDAVGVPTFTWSTSNGSGLVVGDEDQTGLTEGTYCVNVQDGNGCTLDTCFTLTDPIPLTITLDSTNSACTSSTGEVSVVATGGTVAGAYIYDWSPDGFTGDGTDTYSNLPPGTYDVTVTDDNGCTATGQIGVGNLNAPTITLASTNDVDCFGNSTGNIFIDVTDGTPPYTFDWTNGGAGPFTDPEDLLNIPAGTYDVTVQDDAGCTATLAGIVIGEPAAVLDATAVVSDLLCNANNGGTGSIDLTVTGGTTNYNFDWQDGGTTFFTGEDPTGLAAGTYDVFITDANNCTFNDTYVINEPTELDLTGASVGSTCGNSDGEASVTVTGGTVAGAYTYSWTDVSAGQPGTPFGGNNATETGLPAGAYQVVVTDDNGCQDSVVVNVSDVNGPALTSTVTDVNCFGDANGQIDLTATGTPTITFSWSGPASLPVPTTSEDISGAEAGTYTVVATDGLGCTSTEVIVIGGPAGPIDAAGTITDLTCYNDASGEIAVTLSGGTAPYASTSWTGPNGFTSSLEDIVGLDSGQYVLTVVDDNGCSAPFTFDLTQPDSLIITPTITQPTCGLTDGQISVAVTGGTAAVDYGYQWENLTTSTVLGTTNTESNLGAGNYQIDIVDDNGCTATQVIPLSELNAPPLTSVVVDVSCNGLADGEIDLTVAGTNTYTYDWDNDGTGDTDDPEDLTGLTAGTYNVLVNDVTTGCTAALSVDVDEPDVLAVTGITTDLFCNGDGSGEIDITVTGGTLNYSFGWGTADGSGLIVNDEDQTGLGAGTYQVTVTDANNCQQIEQFVLNEPNPMNLGAVVVNNQCNGECLGSISLTVTDGVGPYTFSWTGDITSSNEDLTNLCAGTYNLTITDDNGCTKDTTIIITEPSPVIFDVTTVNADCGFTNGSATANVSGGTIAVDYTYDWSPDGFTGDGTNAYTNLPSGIYTLTVVDDNLCQVDTTVTINDNNAPTVTVDNITDVTCYGGSDGGVDVTVSGGNPGYNFVWNPNAISLLEDLAGAPADDYILQVTDASGCSVFVNATIDQPDSITVVASSNDATCGSCNGDATVAASGGDGSFNYLWSDSQTGTNATNLCAGLYAVQVTDGAGCVVNVDIPVSNVGGPTGETTVTTDVTCGGGNDGSADVTAVGGTPPYSYFWPHNGSATNPQTGMSAGTYYVEMMDDNGCIRVDTVIINEPAPIVATAIIQPATCGGADGSISITTTGGTGVMTYTWSTSANTTSNETGLAEGQVTVTITDGAGCSITEIYYVPGINAPNIALTPVDPLCNGDATGSITGVVTGAVGAMSYQWYDGTGAMMGGETNIDLLNVPAGDYTIEGTDAGSGCIVYTSVTINEPDAITLAVTSTIDATCATSCDGQATAMPLGGTLGYSYSWTSGETTQSATALCSGVNTVTITDANNCVIQQSFVIDENLNLTSSATVNDASCGQCDGDATVAPVGGSGNYTVNWFDASTGTSHNNLCAGVYSYEVVDNTSGCSTQFDVTVNNIGGPDNETITQNDVTCNGGNDGDVTVLPSGGTPPYTYLWVPGGQTTNSLTGLTAGSYNLEVTDDNGCTRVVPITIAEPAPLTVQSLVVDANCGASDGAITLIVNGGTGPYNYLWSGPGVTGNVNDQETGLAVGIYTITVSDATGCSQVVTLPISTTNGPDLAITGTDQLCFGTCDGETNVVASNGSGTYNYQWTDAIGTNLGTADTETGLCGGDYFVVVTDVGNGCTTIAMTTLETPDSIALSVPLIIDASCFGVCDGEANVIPSGGTLPYNISWTSGGTNTQETGLCAGTETVTVTDAQGCVTTQDATINEPTEIVITLDNITDALCWNSTDGAIDVTVTGGDGTYTYDWDNDGTGDFDDLEDLTGLTPMTYILNVQDGANCVSADTFVVDTTIVVLADAGLDTAFCFGGCVELTGSGTNGVTFEWFDMNNNLLSSADTVYVCPDSVGITPYLFTVTNSTCSYTDTVDVEVYGLPAADAGPDLEPLVGSTEYIGGSPTGPTGSTYIWTPIVDFDNPLDSTAANPLINISEEQLYIVYVTDTNGCVNSDTVFVDPVPFVNPPNGFTPNNDGVNDTWQIDFLKNEFPDAVVEVYNRWGQQLFISVGYVQEWDGNFEGKELPVGTYYYVIELNHPLYPDALTGPITIMR